MPSLPARSGRKGLPDRKRWNRKYRRREEGPDWTPDPGLAELGDIAQGGKAGGLALDLACGTGRNALHLACLGYRVVALDVSTEALHRCAREAEKRGLAVHPLCADLDQWPLPESRFDLVVVVRYLDRDLFPAIESALKPGGLLFYKTFNRRFLAERPAFNPDYLLEEGELESAFPGLEILQSNRSSGESMSFILARRP